MWILINVFAVESLHYINTAGKHPSEWALQPLDFATLYFISRLTLLVVVLHVIGYFVLIGVLAGCTPEKQSAKFVFADFQNSTGWDSDFVSWCVSLLAALYAFFSLDSVTHYAEEIDKADILVPRASKRNTSHILSVLRC